MHGDLPMGDTELAYVRALYDGGLRHADRHLGILRQALARLDLADDTLVIVSSDHGEDLGRFPRHAGNHGHTLYDEQVRVPLVMGGATGPVARRRIEVPVRTLDILPTTLEALGVPPLPGLDGRSLLPLIRGRETAGRPAWMRTPPVGGRPERTALRTGAYKLILSAPDAEPETPPVEVFDLAQDPGEQRNLAGSRPDLARALRRDLERARARVHEEGPPEWRPAPGGVPEDLRQRLRSLGYAD
jgi:arylsulfatase A-like enzyme